MRGQHFADPAIETLHHPVRLRRAWFGQPVLDLQRGTQPVEFMLAAGLLLPVEQAVGELAAVIGQDGLDVAAPPSAALPERPWPLRPFCWA